MCVLYDVHLSNLLLMACKEGTAKLRMNIRLAVTRERLIISRRNYRRYFTSRAKQKSGMTRHM